MLTKVQGAINSTYQTTNRDVHSKMRRLTVEDSADKRPGVGSLKAVHIASSTPDGSKTRASRAKSTCLWLSLSLACGWSGGLYRVFTYEFAVDLITLTGA